MRKAAGKVVEALTCKCGACVHWEVLRRGRKLSIFCKTCEEEFTISGLKVPKHDKLHWSEKPTA